MKLNIENISHGNVDVPNYGKLQRDKPPFLMQATFKPTYSDKADVQNLRNIETYISVEDWCSK